MPDRAFLLAVHNHQPVGNFEHVFDRAFRECYEPLLLELHRHPGVRFAVHFSGPLWEYMRVHEKNCWSTLKELVERGQAELLGGGFYEPILAVIPEEDRLGQVLLMQEFLETHFGKRPRGIWLAERVWEPCLPKTLARAGIDFTLLDEEHFHYAGVTGIHASYITEDEGFAVRLFPIDKQLRYLIPFRSMEEIKRHFDEAWKSGSLAVLGDDGEKFGLWPGTHKHVFEDGWLRRFLEFLQDQGIPTMTFSEALAAFPPAGRVYLPPASYEEMMEWTLEPEDQAELRKLKQAHPGRSRRFLRGGMFREFFRKYPESDHLHKRMLLASRAVRGGSNEGAMRELYKSQCNDAYWHGVFGGLYLPHLREAAYAHLIEAERLARPSPGWSSEDYDLDGHDELIYRDNRRSLFLKPSAGGALVELDSLRLGRNMLDVLARRPESYHAQDRAAEGEGKSIHELAKALPAEGGKFLLYDPRPRYSLLDHFYADNVPAMDFETSLSLEQGDFAVRPYAAELFPKESGSTDHARFLRLHRKGHVQSSGGTHPVHIQKDVVPTDSGFLVRYSIQNLSTEDLSTCFSVEWNVLVFPGDWEAGPDRVDLHGKKTSLEFPAAGGVWSYVLETLSQSESGYDIIHQGLCLLPYWELRLKGHESFSLDMTLREHDE